MPTITVTDAAFETDVLKSDLPVLVDFWSETCAPCKAIAPVLEKVSDEQVGKIVVAKINIDENPHTPKAWGVRGAPTLKLFWAGEPVATRVGAAPKSMIEKWIVEQLQATEK